jgi:hypothetical protein
MPSITAKNVTRRTLIVGSICTFATACAEVPIIVNAAKALKSVVIGDNDNKYSREQINKIPYATLHAKIGRGPKSLLVLAKIEGSRQFWLSADNAVLVISNGRIVQTAGFPENLRGTKFIGIDPVNKGLHKPNVIRPSRRTIDVALDNRYSIPISSQYRLLGEREIKLLGVKINTLLVEENNVATSINWQFKNFYWADKFDGFVWKSRQYIARSFPPIEIEVLKPAN